MHSVNVPCKTRLIRFYSVALKNNARRQLSLSEQATGVLPKAKHRLLRITQRDDAYRPTAFLSEPMPSLK
jgi:hypothetical protein